MGGPAADCGLEDNGVFCREGFGAIGGQIRRDKSYCLQKFPEPREGFRILGGKVAFCFLAGDVAGKERKITRPAQFDYKRRFPAGVAGGGEKEIGVDKDAHHLAAASLLSTL